MRTPGGMVLGIFYEVFFDFFARILSNRRELSFFQNAAFVCQVRRAAAFRRFFKTVLVVLKKGWSATYASEFFQLTLFGRQ